jgi:hypothetical protein
MYIVGDIMRRRLPHRIDPDTGLEEKYCKICDKWVDIKLYNVKNASWDGLETCCSACKRIRSKQFREENPDYDKEYQEKNKDQLKQYKREYYMKKKLQSSDSDSSSN